MILTTGKIVFVTDPDESDCYIENLRTEYNTNLLNYRNIFFRKVMYLCRQIKIFSSNKYK